MVITAPESLHDQLQGLPSKALVQTWPGSGQAPTSPTRCRQQNAPCAALKTELVLDAGHIGLVVGKEAHKSPIPTILEFFTKPCQVASGGS